MFYLKNLVSIFYGECRFAVILDLFCFVSIHYEWVDGMVCVVFNWRPIIDLGMCFDFCYVKGSLIFNESSKDFFSREGFRPLFVPLCMFPLPVQI